MVPGLVALVLAGTPAVAQAPGPRVLTGAWPEETISGWRAHASATGLTGPAADAACIQVAPALLQCLVIEEGGRRRLGTASDEVALGGRGAVMGQGRLAAKAALDGFVEVPVPDMPGRSYHVRSLGDGLDTAVVAAPGALHERYGPATVMAFPDVSTTLVWRRGDPELDKVLAVAVHKAWEAASRPVSPRVYRWDGDGLVEWAAARPVDDGSP